MRFRRPLAAFCSVCVIVLLLRQLPRHVVPRCFENTNNSSRSFSFAVHSAVADGSVQRIKILHVIDKDTLESVMDRWFARSHQSFLEQTDLVEEAILWGEGFEGYNAKRTLRENIVSRFGSATHFDAILPYYNQDQVGHLKINPAPYFFEIAEVTREPNSRTVVIDRPHEMRDGRRVPILDLANVTLLLAPYANEMAEHRRYMNRALLVHQPHPVNPALFYHAVEDERPQDIYLAGSLEEALYPLRCRLGRLIEAHGLPGAGVRPHPGYPDILPLEVRQRQGVNGQMLEQQLRDYSAQFGRSKICIVTASRWEYSVQKYHEAAASGCLIIGTLPSDRRTAFRDIMVPISMTQTDEELRQVFKEWLDNEPARLERARRGQDWTLAHFSDRKYVEDVCKWIRAVQSGQRGMIYPYEYTDLPDPLPWDG